MNEIKNNYRALKVYTQRKLIFFMNKNRDIYMHIFVCANVLETHNIIFKFLYVNQKEEKRNLLNKFR